VKRRRTPRIRRAVLGLDAAWTASGSSGVALVQEGDGRWTCAGVAPSYAEFVRLSSGGSIDWRAPEVPGGEADVPALLAAASRLAPGAELSVVAVDMPLAHGPILCRRRCDDAISRAFGGRGCGTHTPSERRPGPVADRLHRAFAERGYGLATTAAGAGERSLIEVYPHPALLGLMRCRYRVPYKAARATRYWPDAAPADRRERLLLEWRRILRTLRSHVAGIDVPLPAAAPSHGRMKRYEDALDALLCAWIGIEFLEGRAMPYGDDDAAVWIPESGGTSGLAAPA
jgi:predicted RNase H-like nuclease